MSGLETRHYRIRLITPLFGGGVEPGEADTSFPIRATSIRGQLRTWWRVLYGSRLGDNMWQREEEIFGSTEFLSPLKVTVLDQPTLDLIDPANPEYGGRFGPIAYALFSAVDKKQKVAKEGIEFRLQISWDNPKGLEIRRAAQNEQRRKDRKKPLPSVIKDISDEIQGAISGWLAFGGLGARTRRGGGSVFCRELGQTKLPSIPGKVLLGPSLPNAIEAWKFSVAAYQEFRQTPRGKKHSKTIQNGRTVQVPGRSHWPEADSIRHVTGCSLKPGRETPTGDAPVDENPHDHSQPVVPQELLPAFPKGVLGLPINYHFADGPGKDRDRKPNPGNPKKDPQDVQLVAVILDASGGLVRLDRMLSPVITRPLWMNGKWHPAVIVLDQRWPAGLMFRLEGKNAKAGGGDISLEIPMDQVVSQSLGVLRPMRGKSSAIAALMTFLSTKGFTEFVQ